MALTEQQQKEWERGAPYSSAFTQDIARQLEAAEALAETPRYDYQTRRLPWLKGKGPIYALYGASSAYYADKLEEKIVTVERDAAEQRALAETLMECIQRHRSRHAEAQAQREAE